MIDLKFKYTNPTLEMQINLKTDNKIIGINGDSGIGKTTFFNLLVGFKNPDEGHIKIKKNIFYNSKNFTNIAINKRSVGYVFQDQRLFSHLNVQQNISYTLHSKIMINEIIDMLELNKILNKKITFLSGGESQRVCIARALACNPEILLLDECFNAIHKNQKKRIMNRLKIYLDQKKILTMIISHQKNESTFFTKEIYSLKSKKGKICLVSDKS